MYEFLPMDLPDTDLHELRSKANAVQAWLRQQRQK